MSNTYEGYEQLQAVFDAAMKQAAVGKGKERHANDLPFHEQRMQSISTLLDSPDGMAYQTIKKMTEGLEFTCPERREAELLGAIVYLAGVVIWLRRGGKPAGVKGQLTMTKREEAYSFMPASQLPPVDTPLVIKLDYIGEVLVERTCYMESKDSELEYVTADGIKIRGRFPWTYP